MKSSFLKKRGGLLEGYERLGAADGRKRFLGAVELTVFIGRLRLTSQVRLESFRKLLETPGRQRCD